MVSLAAGPVALVFVGSGRERRGDARPGGSWRGRSGPLVGRGPAPLARGCTKLVGCVPSRRRRLGGPPRDRLHRRRRRRCRAWWTSPSLPRLPPPGDGLRRPTAAPDTPPDAAPPALLRPRRLSAGARAEIEVLAALCPIGVQEKDGKVTAGCPRLPVSIGAGSPADPAHRARRRSPRHAFGRTSPAPSRSRGWRSTSGDDEQLQLQRFVSTTPTWSRRARTASR